MHLAFMSDLGPAWLLNISQYHPRVKYRRSGSFLLVLFGGCCLPFIGIHNRRGFYSIIRQKWSAGFVWHNPRSAAVSQYCCLEKPCNHSEGAQSGIAPVPFPRRIAIREISCALSLHILRRDVGYEGGPRVVKFVIRKNWAIRHTQKETFAHNNNIVFFTACQ